MKEFCVQELATLLRQLGYSDGAWKASGDQEVPTEALVSIRDALTRGRPILEDLGLKTSEALTRDYLGAIYRGGVTTNELSQRSFNLFKAIQCETETVICFKTDETYIRLMDGDTPFLPHVIDRFPRAVQEIEEAAKCLLYERATPCVFHAMRAVEVVLKAAWKTLGLQPPKYSDSWGALLRPLDEQLEVKPKNPNPSWQANLPFFSGLVYDVRAAKRTYRDSTMHVESNYAPTDARAAFNATKTMVIDAAACLDQDGNILPQLP